MIYKDVFGKEIDISNKKLWLFDMDGTIYKDHHIFKGTIEILKAITDMGGRYVFITNNSSRSVEEYIDINSSISCT